MQRLDAQVFTSFEKSMTGFDAHRVIIIRVIKGELLLSVDQYRTRVELLSYVVVCQTRPGRQNLTPNLDTLLILGAYHETQVSKG